MRRKSGNDAYSRENINGGRRNNDSFSEGYNIGYQNGYQHGYSAGQIHENKNFNDPNTYFPNNYYNYDSKNINGMDYHNYHYDPIMHYPSYPTQSSHPPYPSYPPHPSYANDNNYNEYVNYSRMQNEVNPPDVTKLIIQNEKLMRQNSKLLLQIEKLLQNISIPMVPFKKSAPIIETKSKRNALQKQKNKKNGEIESGFINGNSLKHDVDPISMFITSMLLGKHSKFDAKKEVKSKIIEEDDKDEGEKYSSDDEFEEFNTKIDNLDDLINFAKNVKEKEIVEDKKDIKLKKDDEQTSKKSETELIEKKIIEKLDSSNPSDTSISYVIVDENNNIIDSQSFFPELSFFPNTEQKPSTKNITKEKKNILADQKPVLKKYPFRLDQLSKLIDPLEKLRSLIGLVNIKNSILDMILYYLQDFETKNKNMLHTVITGVPGVGKTECGKIIGEIYAALGVIPTNKFTIVKRTDLVGEYLGHTAHKTQKVIDEAEGGVLFIDEAYSLGSSEKRDSYAKECIDTININLTEKKKKLIVIIAGYENELEKSFFSYNPGLRRRFPFKFHIEGYNHEELRDIFIKKVKDINWTFIKNFPSEKLDDFFKENKDKFPHFGGDIENLLTFCKFSHSRRMFGLHPKNRKKLSYEDISTAYTQFMKNKKDEGKDYYSMYG